MAQQLHYYRLGVEQSLKQLGSRLKGLKANEVEQRRADYGKNSLDIKNHDPLILTYLRQFKDLMILLLVGSAGISFWLQDKRTALILIVLAFFNTTIGFLQEFKADRTIKSLEKLVINQASVIRDGTLHRLPTSQLVPGDIVQIEEGDSIPADMRIIAQDGLSTNDFALTGESNPSRKFINAIQTDVSLGDRHNIVFMGTTVATGHGTGLVISIGMRTELGRIASLSQSVSRETSPLQREMNNIATRVTQGTLILCVVLLPIAIKTGLPFKDAFLFAIGIACSIIPNGLPAAISTSLAGAAGKLAKAKALVKKLSAVESLGATSVILTDKTGTLTTNQMTVEQFFVGRGAYTVSGQGYAPKGVIQDATGKKVPSDTLANLELLFRAGAMASNAHVNPPDSQHPEWYCIGDPTEGAIVTLAMKQGIEPEQLDALFPEAHELAFDSTRKCMTSIRPYKNGQLCAFVKGAPESVLLKTTKIWDHDGAIRPMTDQDRVYLTKLNNNQAAGAMRNLAIAYRVLSKQSNVQNPKIEEIEQDLVWLGMVSIIDPLRAEVPAAMIAARKAHIKVSIVTGDYSITARAIAMRAQLAARAEDIVIVSGEELQQLSDTQVLHLAERGAVIFSRVAPEDKLRIVNLVQSSGHVVAVTGDGINDAPALKRADIGVAMGLTGTDVAKQSAEIVLMDDSFNTLVNTIQGGRVIFQNIKKAALVSFSGNAAELVVNLASLAGATLFHIPLAISVLLILAIDVVAELFPTAALGADKADRDLMAEKPRDPKDHIVNLKNIIDVAWVGLFAGSFAFINYVLFFERHGVDAQKISTSSNLYMQATTLTYLTIVLCQLVSLLQRRSHKGLFTKYQFHNKALWLAMGLSIFSVLNVIYNPFINRYLRSAPLDSTDWLFAIGATIIFIGLREFQRWSNQHHGRESVIKLYKQKAKTLA